MPRKTRRVTAPALPVSKELLDQLVTGPMTPGSSRPCSDQLKKAVLERAWRGADASPRGTEKDHGRRGNHRNGTTPKTVITDDGAVRLEVPRDRDRDLRAAADRQARAALLTTRSSPCTHAA